MGRHGYRNRTWGYSLKHINSNAEEVGPWVARNVFGSWTGCPAIGLEHDGRMIAGVLYENWNRRSIVCHVAVQGLLTPAYLAAIFHYPFVYLGCEKIIAPVSEGNLESIRFISKLGFQEEARLLDAHPEGSLLIFTMSRQSCRFLGERYGQRFTISPEAA